MLFLVFILLLGLSKVTSADRNFPLESLHVDDRIEEREDEIALIRSDIDSVKAEVRSLSGDVKFLTASVMTILKELKTIKDGINLNEGEILADALENRNIEHDQILKRPESEMSTFNANIDDRSGQQNDTDLEQRVTVLEFQMMTVTEDLTTLTETVADAEEDVDNVEGQVTVILADQVIQDERLLLLETETVEIEVSVNNLQLSVLTLELSDAEFNSSIQELNTGLAELNSTVERHETEIGQLDDDLENLALVVDDIDARLSEFELNGTVAFHAYLTAYTSIPEDSVVIFQEDYVNIGGGYDVMTGDFTVPTGKAGLYHFYIHLSHMASQTGDFYLMVNDTVTCRSVGDDDTGSDSSSSSCSVIALLEEGMIKYETGPEHYVFSSVCQSVRKGFIFYY